MRVVDCFIDYSDEIIDVLVVLKIKRQTYTPLTNTFFHVIDELFNVLP